jgi:hypothetical protein
MLSTTCLERKFHDHQQRSIDLGECAPLWEWVSDDGTPEFYIWLGELLDGMATLVHYCSTK